MSDDQVNGQIGVIELGAWQQRTQHDRPRRGLGQDMH
jgi:hypothetical protein